MDQPPRPGTSGAPSVWAQRPKLRVLLPATSLVVLLLLACLNTGFFVQISLRACESDAASNSEQALNVTAFGLPYTDANEDLSSPTTVDLAEASKWLMPLEALQAEFEAGNATVFVLRIPKTSSSALDVLFQNHKDHTECDYNMRRLWDPVETLCSRLFTFMHTAVNLEGDCKNTTGWNDTGWDTGDCMTWIYSYTYEENLANLRSKDRNRLASMFGSSRITCGHYPYGLHRIGHRGTYTYVTALREPVARVISYWNFLIKLGQVQKAIPNETFESWLEGDTPFLGVQKSNLMVRVLCNDKVGIDDRFAPIYGRSFFKEAVQPSRLSKITKVHYECALRNLQRSFALVLDAERINEVIELSLKVSRLFNMRTRKQLVPELYNPTGPLLRDRGMVSMSNLSSSTLERIRNENKWDILLYQQARKLHNISIERLKGIKEN